MTRRLRLTPAVTDAQTLSDFAPAKVNLTLSVLGRRADGFHELDSIVAFADVGVWVTLEQEVQSRHDRPEQTSSGCVAPVESKATQPGPPCGTGNTAPTVPLFLRS